MSCWFYQQDAETRFVDSLLGARHHVHWCSSCSKSKLIFFLKSKSGFFDTTIFQLTTTMYHQFDSREVVVVVVVMDGVAAAAEDTEPGARPFMLQELDLGSFIHRTEPSQLLWPEVVDTVDKSELIFLRNTWTFEQH